MVVSILDNDLYKFSMSYAYMVKYPNAEGTFTLIDRNKTKYSESFVARFKDALKNMCMLSLTTDEFDRVKKKIPYIPEFYWEWLKSFRYDLSKININRFSDGTLSLSVTDKLYRATLYEVPILATVSELLMSKYEVSEKEIIERLQKKVQLANDSDLLFSEFGTRRRFSQSYQNTVVKYLANNSNTCTGTSNVHLALRYNMKPIGTVAHEWVMFHGAQFGYKKANEIAYRVWSDVYHGNLGIALTDTYTYDAFVRSMPTDLLKLFDGVRQDSGDEQDFISRTIYMYRQHNIDPATKTIIFSNALDFDKYKDIASSCEGMIKCAAGIGTNLTNDTDFEKPNIVMKLTSCNNIEGQVYSKWKPCIKVSDDSGKEMGPKDEIERCRKEIE